MATPSKRKTVLPHSLWDNESGVPHRKPETDWPEEEERSQVLSKATPLGPISENDDHEGYSSKSNSGSKGLTRFGIPIKPSVAKTDLGKPQKGKTPHYHKSYNIDQAGPGVIALKDIEALPVCLIKERPTRNAHALCLARPIVHKNLIGLQDSYEAYGKANLVYDYEHFAVSLGCVVGTVEFSEADIATICKELLQGLVYLHVDLNITHGSLDCSNILLTSTGEIKIANIGDSLLGNYHMDSSQIDLRAVGSIVNSLADRTNLLRESGDMIMPALSATARSFVEKSETRSAKDLLKSEFLHLANPGGAWSLKRHYFETLPMGIRIGSHACSS